MSALQKRIPILSPHPKKKQNPFLLDPTISQAERAVEANRTAVAFFLMGLLTLVVGLLIWRIPLLSLPFSGVGIYWLVTGFALKYAGREVPDSAFMLALIFGVAGVVYWLRVEQSRTMRIRTDDVLKEIPHNVHHLRKKTRI